MAITETRQPTEEAVAELVQPEPERFVGLAESEPGGFAGFIGSGDHRAIGVGYIVLSLLFGVASLVADTLYTAHQAHHFLPVAHVFQVYTASRTGAVLLFGIPLFVGLAICVVPLQVGANTIAFPRAAAASFWSWLIGSGLVIAAYAIDGGPAGTRLKAVDLTYAGLALVLVSLVVASMCIVTTVFALRSPGQWMDRVPMFSWSMLVAASLWALTLPVVLASVVLIYVDRHYGPGVTSGVFARSTSQWPQLSWAFAQPQIYVIAIPVLGAATDVISTLAGVRQAHRKALMAAIGLFGILSFGAFAQPSFYPDVQNEAMFIVVAFLIIFPLLVLLGGWATDLRNGKVSLDSPVLFSLGAGLLGLVAVVAGALYSIKALDLHAAGWSTLAPSVPFADGQFLLVVAFALVGASGALVFWSTKIFGRVANEGLARLAALVGVVGGLVAGLPLLVYGFALKAHGLKDSAKFLNGASAVGSALLVVALVLVVGALLAGRGGADPDPWGSGQTFEWSAASPPEPGSFGRLDVVTSAEPLLDRAESEEAS